MAPTTFRVSLRGWMSMVLAFMLLLNIIQDAAGCLNVTLLQPDYIVDENNVSTRLYPLVQNRFNTYSDGCSPLGREVIFLFVPQHTATYRIQTANTGVDTVLILVGADGCTIACNDDIAANEANSRLLVPLVAQIPYTIVIEAFQPEERGNVTMTIEMPTTLKPTPKPSTAPTPLPTGSPVTLPPAMSSLNSSFIDIFTFSDLVSGINDAKEGKETTLIVRNNIVYPSSLEVASLPVINGNKRIRLLGLGPAISTLTIPATIAFEAVVGPGLMGLNASKAIGDFDGDGFPDLAQITQSSSSTMEVRILLANGRTRNVSLPKLNSAKLVEVGDMDDDGADEFGVCSTSECWIVFGNGRSTSITPGFRIKLVVGTQFLSIRNIGDVNGFNDVIVIVKNATTNNLIGIFVAGSPSVGATVANRLLDLSNATTPRINLNATAISPSGDVDGDGINDVVVGTPRRGEIHVLFGPSLTDGLTIKGESLDRFGETVLGGKDFNGDRMSDIAVGAPGYLDGRGAVYLMFSPSTLVPGSKWFTPKVIIVDDLANSIVLYGSSDSARNCGRELGSSDLDGDGVQDLIVLCDTKVFVLFGSQPNENGWRTQSLESLLNGYNAIAVKLNGAVSLSMIGDLDGDGFNDLAFSDGTVANSVGRRRLGKLPFFVLKDSATISIGGIGFIGSQRLSENALQPAAGMEVRNAQFYSSGSTEMGSPCPQGSMMSASSSGECAFCPNRTYCPVLTGQASASAMGELQRAVLASEPVFFALPMDVFKIAETFDNVLAVSYQEHTAAGPSLFGRWVTAEGSVSARPLLIASGDVLVVRREIAGTSLQGSAPALFDVVTATPASFLVVYISLIPLMPSIVSRKIGFPSTIGDPVIISSLGAVPPDVNFTDGGFLTHSIASFPSTGRVVLVVSFATGPRHVLAQSINGGESWTVLQGNQLLSFVPSFPFYIVPGSLDHDLLPSASGGHMVAAAGPSTSVIFSLESFDSGLVSSAVLDASLTLNSSTANLSLPDQSVYGMMAVALPGSSEEYIVVLNLEERLVGYSFRYHPDTRTSEWVSAGKINKGNSRVSYSSAMDVSILSGGVIKAAFESGGYMYTSQYVPNSKDWTSPGVGANISLPQMKELHIVDDFHLWLVRDNWVLLSSLDFVQTLPNTTLVDSMGELAAYAYEGIPFRSNLRTVALLEKNLFGFVCDSCGMGSTKNPLALVENLAIRPNDDVIIVDAIYPFTKTLIIMLENRALDTLLIELESTTTTTSIQVQAMKGRRLLPGDLVPVSIFVNASSLDLAHGQVTLSWRSASNVNRVANKSIVIEPRVQPLQVSPSALILRVPSLEQVAITTPSQSFELENPSPNEDVFVQSVSPGCGFPLSDKATFTLLPATNLPMTSSAWSLFRTGFAVDLARLSEAFLAQQSTAGWLRFCLVFNLTFARQERWAQIRANISIIVSQPCPPGSFSSTGTNEDGCVLCTLGTYQPASGSTGCGSCPSMTPQTAFAGAKSLDDCQALENFVKYAPGKSMPCPYGANCSVSSDVATLRLLPGFWRGNTSSAVIRKCRHSNFCVGSPVSSSVSTASGISEVRRLASLSNADQVCKSNHMGVMCEQCVAGTFKRSGYCQQCTAGATSEDQGRFAGLVLGMLLLVVVGFALFLAIGLYVLRNKLEEDVWLSLTVSSMAKLKVVLGLMQITAGTVMNNPLAYPQEFRQFATAFGFFYFDMLNTLDFACAFTFVPGQQYTSLLVSTLMPLLVFLVIGICGGVATLVYSSTRDAAVQSLIWSVMREMTVFVLFLVYPGVSNTILRTFRCEYIDEVGVSVLWVEPSITCYDSTWGSYVAYAAVMTVLYIYFVPVWFLRLSHKAYRSKFSSLVVTASYRTKFAWFEAMEMAKKCLQIGVSIFFPTAAGQFLFELGVTLLCALWLIDWKPFVVRWEHLSAGTVQLCLYIIIFAGLLATLDFDLIVVRIPLEVDMTTLNNWLFVVFFLPVSLVFVAEGLWHMFLWWRPDLKAKMTEKRPKGEDEESNAARSDAGKRSTKKEKTSEPRGDHQETPPASSPPVSSAAPGCCARLKERSCGCLGRQRKPKLGWFMGDFESDEEEKPTPQQNDHDQTHNHGVAFI